MADRPTISVNGKSYAILCGLCNVPIDLRDKANPQTSDVGCAACSNWGNQQEVGQIAVKFVTDNGQIALNRMARDAVRRSKIITFKGQTVNDERYRFTVEGLF